MISLFSYIKNIFNQYSSFLDFYIKELNMYISLFETINFLILCFIFFFLFLKFIIIRYTLKKVIVFILKRIFIAFIFFIFFSLFPIFCDNSVISKLFDTNTKKVCIATIAITGCYLSYKYIPIYYKTVISHNNYINYLKEKDIYDNQYKDYNIQMNKYNSVMNEYNLEINKYNIQMEEYNNQMQKYDDYLKSREILNKQNKLITEYNSDIENYNKFLNSIDINFKKLFGADKLDLFFKNPAIMVYNNPLQYFKNTITHTNTNINEYDQNFSIIYNNIKNSSILMEDSIYSSNCKYKIKKSFFVNQENCFNDFNNLMNFYIGKLMPALKKYTKNNSLEFTPESILNINNLMIEADSLIDKSVNSSSLMYSNLKNINKLALLVEPVDLFTPNLWYQKVIEKPIVPFIEKPIVPSIEKPIVPSIELEPINFPIENLEGFRYIGINVGYVIFYPILYSSNKILGTCNPLSNQLFLDAISNLISLIKFF